MDDCYINKPLYTTETGIPIFSAKDSYIRNYDNIANDHNIKRASDQSNKPDTLHYLEESTVELMLKYLSPGDKVLDIGVSTGQLLEKVDMEAKIGVQKYGVDIAVKALEIAKTKKIHVCLAKVEELPYKDNYFDMIVCTSVLEHVFNEYLAVENMLRVLRKGGILILRVPLNENLESYFDDAFPYEYEHVRSYSLFSLKGLFEKIFGQHIKEYKVEPYIDSAGNLFVHNINASVYKRLELIQENLYRPNTLFAKGINFFHKRTQHGRKIAEALVVLYDVKSKLNKFFRASEEKDYRFINSAINIVVRKSGVQ